MSTYFEDQSVSGWSGTPITPPPAPDGNTPKIVETPVAPQEFKGLPVRAAGDRVFIISKGRKYWISSPEAMAKLGFKLGDEVKIDQESLDVFPEGEPIK